MSLIAFERGVFEAALHENKWSPCASSMVFLAHLQDCGAGWLGSWENSGRRNFRRIAVLKTAFSNRNSEAVSGREKAMLVSGESSEGKNMRWLASVIVNSLSIACSLMMWFIMLLCVCLSYRDGV